MDAPLAVGVVLKVTFDIWFEGRRVLNWVNDYFMRLAEREKAERAELWGRVPTNLQAAGELRCRLRRELEGCLTIRRHLHGEFRKDPKLAQFFDAFVQDQVESQLTRLDEAVFSAPQLKRDSLGAPRGDRGCRTR